MKPKLLAPAGNFEKLKVAVAYGADEVYFGLQQFSLRNFSKNFTIESAEEAIAYLHERNKKGYVTLNIYPFEHEYEALLETARQIERIGADAIIVADLGVLQTLKDAKIKTPLHISTQANTLSPQTVMAYKKLGASRVNLARELSIDQIRSLQNNIHGIETEVFVHGAVCFSYSGRCSISDYLTGRRANRGECTHPCRWKYHLHEDERPGETLTAYEDERGLYLFNSKDLALFKYVGQLADANITSLKIEGRMKTIHYLASIVSLYRRILDGDKLTEEQAMQLLSRVMNRGYSEGFMKGGTDADDYRFFENSQQSHSKFVGIIESGTDTSCIMDIRNKVTAHMDVEILTTDGHTRTWQFPGLLKTSDGEQSDVFNHGKKLHLPIGLPPYSILRRLS